MQGTQDQSLVKEYPTCLGATKPIRHLLLPLYVFKLFLPLYAFKLLRLSAATTEALVPKAHAPQQEKPPPREAHAPQLESSPSSRQ